MLTGFLFPGGQKWHPDKCADAGSSGGGSEAAKARFQKIQGAYAGTLILSGNGGNFSYYRRNLHSARLLAVSLSLLRTYSI